MSPLRVVFDTNAFHGAAFDALEASPLKHLCARGRVTAVYGHVFFEECLRAYGSEKRRPLLLQRWLPLIFATAPSICKDWYQTWHEELVEGRGRKFWPFISPRVFASIQQTAAHAPLDGSWHVYKAALKEEKIEFNKRNDQRQLLVSLRQTVARRGIARSKASPVHVLLREFGPGLILKHVRCRNPKAVASRWLRNPSDYPFFTQFAINLIYLANFAATENNKSIDLNAQADLDVLTHLIHADIVVSNETGFLKSAFEQLWRPEGKVLMTTEEFVAHAKLL